MQMQKSIETESSDLKNKLLGEKKSSNHRLVKEFKYFLKTKELFILCLVPLIILLVFSYFPILGTFIAFKNVNYTKGLFGSPWCGFDNFKFFFTSQDAFRTTRNTLLMNLSFIAATTVLSIFCALKLYNLTRKFVKTFQTVLFIPYFLSWVVISYVAYVFLNPEYGLFNAFLKFCHLPVMNWYNDPTWWPLILLFWYLWKNVGYTTIIYYTGLLGIDPAYYEAASIDGASNFQKTMKITMPLLAPLVTLMVLLGIGRIFFSDFGLFYFVPKDSGMLYPVTDVIDTYVYRSLRVTGDIGMAAAAGFYQSLVGFILVLLSNRIVKMFNKENAIF
jgi:putative aldouronate transport system permease protein